MSDQPAPAIQTTQPATAAEPDAPDSLNDNGDNTVYPMSPEGRRQAVVLMLGVAALAIFALWSFINILQDGVDGVEWVSGLLTLAVLVVCFPMSWTLLEEARAKVEAGSGGITYTTVGGIRLHYAWSDVAGIQAKPARGRVARFFLGDDKETGADWQPGMPGENVSDEEPGTMLLDVRKDPSLQIANPLVRFLHKQAYSNNLPIHGGLEARHQLLEEIYRRTKDEGQPAAI